MIKKLNRIKEMPFRDIISIILRKICNTLYYKYRKIVIKLSIIDIDNSKFENWKSNVKFIFDENNKDYYIDILREKGESEVILLKAEKICNHTFDILGSGEYTFSDEIKWNTDFKSGFIWENEFYRDIKIIDLKNDADVKVPWELSRFHHSIVLGQAYWITGNEKYSKEFENQIEDWIRKNPVEYSVNWTCTMDVSTRACNWIIAYMYFNNNSTSKEFKKKFNKSLFCHGEYIYKNLEKSYPSNNHYLSNLVGLIWIGLYFSNLNYKSKKIKKWLNFSLKELEKEIDKQVYDDGFDFESSTYYHCSTTELLLYNTIFCNKNNVIFSRHFTEKLEKMCEVIMNITKPNGLIPLIGDMDSGKFIAFSGYGDQEMRDFRYLLGVAGEYFNRDDFRYNASNQLTAFWMFPNIKMPPQNNYQLSSVTYPEGGIHILRDKEMYLLIKCGQNGNNGNGGHTHNDQLSFELNVKGIDFIVDPGTYVYTANAEMRNCFRSTKYHNTVQIKNLEQNDFVDNNLFILKNQTKSKVLNITEKYFKGMHQGYYEEGFIHEREIDMCDGIIKLNDKIKNTELTKVSNVEIISNLILAKKVAVEIKEDKLFLKKGDVTVSIESDAEFLIKDCYLSEKYGEIIKTNCICMKLEFNKDSYNNLIIIQKELG